MGEIAIREQLSSATIQVNAGDDIRWTNKLMTPVRITFSDYVLNKLSCRSNFEGHFYNGADTDLQPNESASLCFYKPGTIRYVVRMEIDNREAVESGQVQVGAFEDIHVQRTNLSLLRHYKYGRTYDTTNTNVRADETTFALLSHWYHQHLSNRRPHTSFLTA